LAIFSVEETGAMDSFSDQEWVKFLCNTVGLTEESSQSFIRTWRQVDYDPDPRDCLLGFFESQAGTLEDRNMDQDFLARLGFCENTAGNVLRRLKLYANYFITKPHIPLFMPMNMSTKYKNRHYKHSKFNFLVVI